MRGVIMKVLEESHASARFIETSSDLGSVKL